MYLTISTLTLESFLLVVVRTACFTATAPLFGHKSVNARLRILMAMCFSLSIFMATDTRLPEYDSVLGYSLLVIKEAMVGLSIGFVSSMIMSMLIVAGEFIDREIGFTMASSFDPSLNANVTITAELYDKLIYVVLLVSNLHYYMLTALAQSFEVVPIGHANIDYPHMYNTVLGYIGQYFSIGFSIAMPIFIGTTILNVVLGVLAKTSPQMNMFAVGMQIKVLFGLFVLSISIMFVPNIASFLMSKMESAFISLIGGL